MSLTRQECAALALHLDRKVETVVDVIADKTFHSFRVVDLKKVLRWMRDQPAFHANPHIKLSGRKSELIDNIVAALNHRPQGTNSGHRQHQHSSERERGQSSNHHSNSSHHSSHHSNHSNHARPSHRSSRGSPHHSRSHSPRSHSLHPRYGSPHSPLHNAAHNTLDNYRPLTWSAAPDQGRAMAAAGYGDWEQLRACPQYKEGRSPLHSTRRVLVHNTIPPSNILLSFSLRPAEFQELKLRRYLVQLRLFSTARAHVRWDRTMKVVVNGQAIPIAEMKKKSSSKKKGFEVIRPLDLGIHCQSGSNCIEVEYFRPNTFQLPDAHFNGVVVAELVAVRRPSELVEEIRSAQRQPPTPPPLAPGMTKCGVCLKTDNLSRCSSCRSKWYCSKAHQTQDWPQHRLECRRLAAPVPKVEVKLQEPQDDELEEVATLVSLECPITIERIEVPAKGKDCIHLRCFNLETYLMFCDENDIWQCPLCNKPLPYSSLLVDAKMELILKETSEDILKVRVKPNGEWKEVLSMPDPDGPPPAPRVKRQKASAERPEHKIEEVVGPLTDKFVDVASPVRSLQMPSPTPIPSIHHSNSPLQDSNSTSHHTDLNSNSIPNPNSSPNSHPNSHPGREFYEIQPDCTPQEVSTVSGGFSAFSGGSSMEDAILID